MAKNDHGLIMKAAWLGILLCLGFSVGPCRMSAAPDSERELDARFVGCWKYATGFGVVFFHSALPNGDFERSMYERGKFMFASRGKWYVEGGVFHIEISKRRTRESGEEYLPAHARFDQTIVAAGENWYEVKEPSALHVIHWVKISDVTEEVTKAKNLRNQAVQSTTKSVPHPADQEARQP